ncbi:hypothetical protein M8C21_029739, partial [Ambrosia artemisiifolia]
INRNIDYFQCLSALAVLIFFLFLFQLFLPLSNVDPDFFKQRQHNHIDDVALQDYLLKEIAALDFGDDVVKFVPTRLSMKFQTEKDNNNNNVSFGGSRTVTRFGNRKPQLALVFADLLEDSHQVLMVTLAAALKAIGYELEVYSLEDGPVHSVWRTIGVPVHIMDASDKSGIMIDWLSYDGVLVNSLAAKDVISWYMAVILNEPFKSVPLIWTVHEKTLATRAAR